MPIKVSSTDGSIIITPLRDGVDHLNVYSMSRNALGRSLSNFASVAVDHPTLGYFKSIEGAWMYLSRQGVPEKIRDAYGTDAKRYGSYPRNTNDQFEKQILSITAYRLFNDISTLEALLNIDLPITHYYTFGKSVKDASRSNMFQLRYYRAVSQTGEVKCPLTDAMLIKI
jgi:hypothetical protein